MIAIVVSIGSCMLYKPSGYTFLFVLCAICTSVLFVFFPLRISVCKKSEKCPCLLGCKV